MYFRNILREFVMNLDPVNSLIHKHNLIVCLALTKYSTSRAHEAFLIEQTKTVIFT